MTNIVEFFKSVVPTTDQDYYFIYEDWLDDADTVSQGLSSFTFPSPLVGVALPINTDVFTLKLPDGGSQDFRIGTVAGFTISGFIVKAKYKVVHNVVSLTGREQSFTMNFETFPNLP